MTVEHVDFDEAHIAAATASFRAAFEPLLQLAGASGAAARMCDAVIPAFYRAVFAEMNRGVDEEQLFHAVAATLANMGLFYTSGLRDSRPDRRLDVLEALLDQAVADFEFACSDAPASAVI